MNSRFESIRIISNKRTPTVKPFLNNPEVKNPKHAEVLAGCGINYDSPLSPVDVAQRRADRIAKDKLAAAVSHIFNNFLKTILMLLIGKLISKINIAVLIIKHNFKTLSGVLYFQPLCSY